MYRRCVDCPFDFQRLYIVEPGFSIYTLVICEQFVAFTSTSEVRVLQVTTTSDTPSLLEQGFDRCVGFGLNAHAFLAVLKT